MSLIPQFSLRRLLVGTTVFCVAIGLIVAFPREALRLSLSLPYLAATGVVTYYSRSWTTTLSVCSVCALLVMAYWPVPNVSYRKPPSRATIYLFDFQHKAIPPGVGAAVGGCVSLFFTGAGKDVIGD